MLMDFVYRNRAICIDITFRKIFCYYKLSNWIWTIYAGFTSLIGLTAPWLFVAMISKVWFTWRIMNSRITMPPKTSVMAKFFPTLLTIVRTHCIRMKIQMCLKFPWIQKKLLTFVATEIKRERKRLGFIDYGYKSEFWQFLWFLCDMRLE